MHYTYGMRRWPLLAAYLLGVFVASATAQTKVRYSRFDFGNRYHTQRADLFPNSRAKNGNVDGDMIYKAFPASVFSRGDKVRISGVRLWAQVDPTYVGPYPAFLVMPDIVFFPLIEIKVGNNAYAVPDVTKPHARRLPLGAATVIRGGLQPIDFRLGPHQPDPRLKLPVELPVSPTGWAVGVMAPAFSRQLDGNSNFVAVSTFGEVHRSPGRLAYSGLYDAAKQAHLPYGTAGAPSNIGELAIELYLDQPSLQVFSDGSGGVRNDPRRIETHKGPGAYANGLSTAVAPGWFGLFTQWEGMSDNGILCLPLITAIGPAMPTTLLKVDDATLVWDSLRAKALSVFIENGVLGILGRYKAGGVAGHANDQGGVFASTRISVPNDAGLKGATIWVQSVLIRFTTGRVVGATNLSRIVF